MKRKRRENVETGTRSVKRCRRGKTAGARGKGSTGGGRLGAAKFFPSDPRRKITSAKKFLFNFPANTDSGAKSRELCRLTEFKNKKKIISRQKVLTSVTFPFFFFATLRKCCYPVVADISAGFQQFFRLKPPFATLSFPSVHFGGCLQLGNSATSTTGADAEKCGAGEKSSVTEPTPLKLLRPETSSKLTK